MGLLSSVLLFGIPESVMHNSDTSREGLCMRNENEGEFLCTLIAGIKCKNVWVWKNSRLSCLSGMTLKSVMHVTQELRF
ncbi:unnamed protein product, partial [Amoebophrya sp. A120]|eukprot:GSA120T00020043001.1